MLALAITLGSYFLKNKSNSFEEAIPQFVSYLKYKILFSTISEVKKDKNQNSKLIPALVYHGIVDKTDRFSMTQNKFAEQMRALKEDGYETISMKDFYDFIYNDKKIPEKSFLLTFDDGRKDSYYGSDPVLKALDYHAVMFIATGVSIVDDNNSTYYLNENEIKNIYESKRWDIDSHMIQWKGGFVDIDEKESKGNFLSNAAFLKDLERLENRTEYESRVSNEIELSKKTIEDLLDNNVLAMSYPFGDYGQQTINLDKDYTVSFIKKEISNNYKIAFRQIWPIDHEFSQNAKGDNPILLKRIEPSTDWSGEKLVSIINSGQEKKLPWRDIFKSNLGWRNVWGDLEIKDNKLYLGANTKTTGSFAILDGTSVLDNYIFNVLTDWKSGSHISLITRYEGADDYVSCTFSDSQVRIEERKKGKIEKLAESKIEASFPKEKINLSVSVFGNKAKCFLDNRMVLSTDNLSIRKGGIGIKTWDEKENTSKAEIYETFIKKVENNTIVQELLENK